MALKHVGRVKKTQRKVVVAYRTLPNDPDHCVVVTTENLEAADHDSLMKAVESDAGQSAYEFAEAMARVRLTDGRNMLAGFHTRGKMVKFATNEIEMLPDNKTVIPLNELNEAIAQQKGVSVEDLAIKGSAKEEKREIVLEEKNLDDPVNVAQPAQASVNEVLSDEDLAAKYRSDADRLFKEAKKLREQAEELVPTKKNAKKESA